MHIKAQFLTLKCSLHLPKEILSGMLGVLVGTQMDKDLVQQDLVGQRPKQMTSIAKNLAKLARLLHQNASECLLHSRF